MEASRHSLLEMQSLPSLRQPAGVDRKIEGAGGDGGVGKGDRKQQEVEVRRYCPEAALRQSKRDDQEVAKESVKIRYSTLMRLRQLCWLLLMPNSHSLPNRSEEERGEDSAVGKDPQTSNQQLTQHN